MRSSRDLSSELDICHLSAAELLSNPSGSGIYSFPNSRQMCFVGEKELRTYGETIKKNRKQGLRKLGRKGI